MPVAAFERPQFAQWSVRQTEFAFMLISER